MNQILLTGKVRVVTAIAFSIEFNAGEMVTCYDNTGLAKRYIKKGQEVRVIGRLKYMGAQLAIILEHFEVLGVML